MIYSNEHYAVYFIPNGTPEKEHDIQTQFQIVNKHLGTVEAMVASIPHAVQYADVFAKDWEAMATTALGKFNPDIQRPTAAEAKELVKPQPAVKLATVDGENV